MKTIKKLKHPYIISPNFSEQELNEKLNKEVSTISIQTILEIIMHNQLVLNSKLEALESNNNTV